MRAIEDQIRTAIEKAGLPAPAIIVIDGCIHRFSTKPDRLGDRAGYYCFYRLSDELVTGFYGDWRSGVYETFYSGTEKKLRSIRSEFEKLQQQLRNQKETQEKEASLKAKHIWQKASEHINHAYIEKKKIKPLGIRQYKNYLLVPVMDGADLVSLQFITPQGEKRFLKGGRTQGCFFALGQGEPFYIAEGYATAMTVYQAIEGKGTVVVAFNANNLLPVARQIREKDPYAQMVICADNDQFTPNNPGLTKAKETAKQVGAFYVLPHFKDLSTKPTDFNDLFILEGLEAVKACLNNRHTARKSLKIWVGDQIPEEDVRWLWEPYLPWGQIVTLDGVPGVGKTWVALAVCAKLTAKGLRVIYDTTEDSTIIKRFKQIDGGNLHLFGIIKDSHSLDEIDLIEETISAFRPVLFVIDPVTDFFNEKKDFYKATDMGQILAPVADLAKRYSCTFLLIRHLRKGKTDKALNAGLGSIAIAGKARSGLLVAEKNGEKILAQIKNTFGPLGPSLAFEIKEGRFYWVGQTQINGEELLETDRYSQQSTIEEAMKFLMEILSDGPCTAKDIINHAKLQGISPATLRRAKETLGVKTTPIKEKGKFRGHLWALPDDHEHLAEHLVKIEENQAVNQEEHQMLSRYIQNETQSLKCQLFHKLSDTNRQNNQENQIVTDLQQEGYKQLSIWRSGNSSDSKMLINTEISPDDQPHDQPDDQACCSGNIKIDENRMNARFSPDAQGIDHLEESNISYFDF